MSSSTVVEAKPSDGPGIFCGQSSDATEGGQYKLQWHYGMTRPTKNVNGTTGMATILQSTNAAYMAGLVSRIHLCAHNPCTAMWTASKYGLAGIPMHLQELQAPSLAAVEAAVAEPSNEAPSPLAELAPVEPVPVVEPAPVAEPQTVVEPPEGEAPDSPRRVALKSLKPPAPATALDVIDEGDVNATAVAVTAVAASAVAARHQIEATLLALAREIRRPRAYVGYSAFILMGLRMKCQPFVWEGQTCIDLLEVFAPWAKESCTTPCPVTAIPCALRAEAGGSVEIIPISAEYPISKSSHFVAGIAIPQSAVAATACGFEIFYAALGVATLASVLDGDCGLDVMTMMLGRPTAFVDRSALRVELSDYLIQRIGEHWMQDLMAVCQELQMETVTLSRSGEAAILAVPIAPAPAVAEPAAQLAVAAPMETPSAETFAAMRWASKLEHDSNVLILIRSLPSQIVDEQVRLYRQKEETAVAETAKEARPILSLSHILAHYHERMKVAQRFHLYCQSNGILVHDRLPYGVMRTFIKDNVAWKADQKALQSNQVRRWYHSWLASPASTVVAVKDTAVAEKCLLRSRAPKKALDRERGHGAGRPFAAPLIRQELYEWWCGLRYAIDWRQHIAERRSRGKKHLARFPRSILVLKVNQLLQEMAYACLLNGRPVQCFKPDSWWFKRWEEEYGLSMRQANRKYAVPRNVLKERLEIFWVVLFRLRYLILLVFGYDPLLLNWDQSPFHHNETGSQNKPTLGIRGATVPVVEGKSDVQSRWTANLMTQSRFTAVAGGSMPATECMFKAEPDGPVDAHLQTFLRNHRFPSWFTVTVAPKGSYREQDVIEFLQKHLEEWKEGRDWRLIFADDFSAHKTDNVWLLCWSRGYILLIHGGGATPVGQTCDTDLNQPVRCDYGNKEACILIEQMRSGRVVPKLSHKECMLLMFEVLSNPELHKQAAEGYKKVGQSIDLHGKEDALVCREAGVFWNEETTDGYQSMRPKIDSELAAVADEFKSGGIAWCQKDIRRLITPYPSHKKADAILARLGDDFYHDDIQGIDDNGDDTAVAEGDHDAPDSSSDGSGDDDAAVAGDGEPAGHVDAAVAGDDEQTSGVEDMEIVPLSASQADAVHEVRITIAALESASATLQAIGSVRGVQVLMAEVQKEKRKERRLVTESPAVADAFFRLRRAEENDNIMKKSLNAKQNDRKREAAKAIADRDTAVADLKRTRISIQELENLRASKYAIKSFTLAALGEGTGNAGGAKAKKNRFDVLDRLARIKVGLSAGQKNDWPWFKEAWDKAMVTQHAEHWAARFAEWVQSVLDDDDSNAFSLFVYNETCRVFHGIAALHVPGS